MNNSVLVTGGMGFLGSHLALHLAEKGYTVRIFASHRSQADQSNETNFEVVYGDIRDSDAVEKAVKGVDRIIHLVSNFRRGGSDKNEAYAINVEGTENVLNSALKYKIRHLIHCSTIGVHGNVKEIPASEETAFNPGDLYQETKLIAEKKVWEFYKQNRLPTTVIRPISMFGPGDMRMLKLFSMIKKGRFIIVGDGKPFFQPAYIDDVVQGFMRCLENEKAIGEAFIIGGDEYVTLNKLCRLIANEFNVKPPQIKIPLTPVLWLAAICEVLCSPLNIEPPLHRRRVSFFQNNRAFSIEKAKNIIDFQPQVSLIEGIRRTIQWYENQGLL